MTADLLAQLEDLTVPTEGLAMLVPRTLLDQQAIASGPQPPSQHVVVRDVVSTFPNGVMLVHINPPS